VGDFRHGVAGTAPSLITLGRPSDTSEGGRDQTLQRGGTLSDSRRRPRSADRWWRQLPQIAL